METKNNFELLYSKDLGDICIHLRDTIENGQTIVLYSNIEELDIAQIIEIYTMLQKEFPNNKVVSLPHTATIRALSKEQLVELRDYTDQLLFLQKIEEEKQEDETTKS